MRLLVGFFLIMFLIGSVSAGDHYIRAGATGLNNGNDWANAWVSLPDSLIRGDIYYIADGNYGSYTFDDAVDGDKYIYIKKAIGSEHGTDEEWQSDYGDGQAIFSATSGGVWAVTTSNWIFDGQIGGGPGNWKSGHGFKLQGTLSRQKIFYLGYAGQTNRVENLVLNHIEIKHRGMDLDSDEDGIYANAESDMGPKNVKISNCYIHNVSRVNLLTRNIDSWLFEYNYVARSSSSPAVHGEAWADGGGDNIIIRNNIFSDIEGTGIIVMKTNKLPWSNENWEVYNNIFMYTQDNPYKRTGLGMGVFCKTTPDGTSHYVKNISFHHNSIINLNAGDNINSGVLFPDFNGIDITENVRAYNNIWYNSYPVQIINTEHDYNLFIDSPFAWNTKLNINEKIGGENPFIDWQNYNFHLTNSTLPGTILRAPFNIDPEGNIRGLDGNIDAGAFEYFEKNSSSLIHHKADLNKDYRINVTEIRLFIDAWLGGSAGLSEVIGAIRIWSHGECYNEEVCETSAQSFVFSEDVEIEEVVKEEIPLVSKNFSNEILWLKFDGDFVDSSGNRNVVSAIGDVGFVEGKSGQAVGLDGDGDRLAISSLPVLATKTISFWAKFDEYKNYNVVFEDIKNDYVGFDINGALRVNWENVSSGNEAFYFSKFAGKIGKWTFYVITYEVVGNELTMKFYQDGALIKSMNRSSGLVGNSITSIGDRNTGRHSFSGDIDDFRVWDRALSEEEIEILSEE